MTEATTALFRTFAAACGQIEIFDCAQVLQTLHP
jgi:hypothetical protein